ncbi:MAG TPA: MFS transporter [Dongiaceae bacterium]|jgi:MFS family permease
MPVSSIKAHSFGSPRPGSLLAPLRNVIYRRLWIAALFSNFGVWIQSVAAAWLMTSIAPTVDFVAWVQAATSLPPLLFTVFGGVLADRFDQRLVFLIAQLIVLTVALSLSVLDQFSLMTPWLLLGLTFALDSGSALRYPAYQTTIYDLLPREQIASALVLSSIGWNIARAAGPGLGGLIIATMGVQAAFAINALCNVYIIFVLFRWRRQKTFTKAPPQGSIWAALADGFVHVHATPTIRAAMVRCFVLTLFSAALWSLLPLVAKNMVGGGPSVYGLMLGALGIGALGGAGCIAWMRDHLGYRRLFAISSICLAASTLAMATISALIPLLIILAIGGLGWMISMSTFNLVVQMSAAETHRGRAISVYYIALFGGLALGSWAFGHVAENFSVRTGLLAATVGLAASLLLYRARSSAPHPFSESPEPAPAE